MHVDGEHFVTFILYCKLLVNFVPVILLAIAWNENLLLEEFLCDIQFSWGKYSSSTQVPMNKVSEFFFVISNATQKSVTEDHKI